MIKISFFKKFSFYLFILSFAFLLVWKPQICKTGVINAVILCGQVLIPSLFPFGVCVIFIMKSGILNRLYSLSPLTCRLFGLPADLFSLMLLSMVGGYPIGAKLLNEAVKEKRISEYEGCRMLNFCINAGPAFIISAVGSGILKSEKMGFILLFSHLTASLIICESSRFFKKPYSNLSPHIKKAISSIDNFVISASDAASVTLNICTFVILFSAINSYIEYFADELPFLRFLLYFTEVTFAVTKTRNIYFISFLLGFGGFCIWCQIFSTAKSIKIKPLTFVISRIAHGLLSMTMTKILLFLFPLETETFSNNVVFSKNASVSGVTVGIALLTMSILFVISLSGKVKNIKILEEFI